MKILALVYRYYFKFQGFLRTNFWKLCFAKFGKGAKVYGRIVVIKPENIIFGNASTLNEGVFLNARVHITIGAHVHISPGCLLNTGSLEYQKILDERKHVALPIVIEDGVWLGSGVIVNPGVTIGKNSVVGAGAVVTRDIPENSLAVGVPAKVIKKIG